MRPVGMYIFIHTTYVNTQLTKSGSLLQAGCSKVYITSRKAKACEEAVAALNALPNKRPGAQAISVPSDNSKIEELDKLVAEVKKTTDHVDILFANAGATWGASFDEYPEKQFSKVMDLNVKSVFYLLQKYVSYHRFSSSLLNLQTHSGN
jgi:NAD(P)-dependent dehydrogenase (short-subunit alcohol dehydrogenase family)